MYTTLLAALIVTAFTGAPTRSAVRAQTETTVIKAQGHPYLNDFLALSQKRADLRMSALQKGLNRAFTEWLRVERAHVYRAAIRPSTNR